MPGCFYPIKFSSAVILPLSVNIAIFNPIVGINTICSMRVAIPKAAAPVWPNLLINKVMINTPAATVIILIDAGKAWAAISLNDQDPGLDGDRR